jgi:DNA-binding FadR family transcriptional regulator
VNIKLELELDRDFSIKVYAAHERILDALRNRDPAAANREMLRHIEEVDEMMVAFCDAEAPFEP